ncbi:hypothetical protein ARALYDRAFT_328137 [Arabidopsis lyrata subsp. lyrata]|uniref:Uncharacterized protein n=1 Tax=Arabidopsis lyrata subsp. lyrata TaxID=81972 RepID=D7MBN7_ARALL|nr:hypothetical protein ARALYDRAFT_328137 [Arabidopsis lyrata subsp. lyrata]
MTTIRDFGRSPENGSKKARRLVYPKAWVIRDRISATAIASSLFIASVVVFRRRDSQRLSLVDLRLVERDREQCAGRISLRRRQIRRSFHHRTRNERLIYRSAKRKHGGEKFVESQITVKFRNPEKIDSVSI